MHVVIGIPLHNNHPLYISIRVFKCLQLAYVSKKFSSTVWFEYHIAYRWGGLFELKGFGVSSNHQYSKEYYRSESLNQ